MKTFTSLVKPSISLVGQAAMKNATDAMRESRVHDLLSSVIKAFVLVLLLASYETGLFDLVTWFAFLCFLQLSALQYRKLGFEEFCAATLNVHQLEALERWEQHARCAYELFEKDGNRAIIIDELASV